MIKAVVFDMDGVLIDARDWHYEALNRALGLFGFEINREEHAAKYDGLPTSKKLEMLSEEKDLPRTLHQLINKLKQDFTTEITLLECRPVFQHEYALSMLKQRGIKVAVASNSIASTIELMMRKANLEQYLDFYLSNEDVSQPKPSPEIYDKAIAKLGVSPREVLIVEDNEHGLAAARASKAHVLKVESPADVRFEAIVTLMEKLGAEANA